MRSVLQGIATGFCLLALMCLCYWAGFMDSQSRLVSHTALTQEQWDMAISLGEGLGATRAMKACLEQRGLRDDRPATQPGR